MKLGIYSLRKKVNRTGYYLFHILIGVVVSSSIQISYINYVTFQDYYIYKNSIEILLLSFIGFFGGNFLMLRGNENKKKYIRTGLLIIAAVASAGTLIKVIPTKIQLYKLVIK